MTDLEWLDSQRLVRRNQNRERCRTIDGRIIMVAGIDRHASIVGDHQATEFRGAGDLDRISLMDVRKKVSDRRYAVRSINNRERRRVSVDGDPRDRDGVVVREICRSGGVVAGLGHIEQLEK